MKFLSLLKKLFVFSVVALQILSAQGVYAQLDPAYEAGPNRNTPMGREIIDIYASYPDNSGMYVLFKGEDKFRKVFGPIIARMIHDPDSVVILIQGQDGTHAAEASGEPGTAGFGGRVMSITNHVGVSDGVAFTNAFASTIKGQYSTGDTPILVLDKNGNPKDVIFSNVTQNDVWAMSMDVRSPLVQFRHKLISWIIRNNKNSLKAVLLLGGASKDAFSVFVQSHGGQVASKTFPGDMTRYRILKTNVVGTGGNGQTAQPLTKDGQDLYAAILGKKEINYLLPQKPKPGEVPEADQARNELKKNFAKWVPQMDLLTGGVGGTGLIHPAQIGGFEIENGMMIGGKKTGSLKGLTVDGYTIPSDIAVVSMVHPTVLSSYAMTSKQKASDAVTKAYRPLEELIKEGKIEITPEKGFVNKLLTGAPYTYGYGEQSAATYAFGTSVILMGNTSNAGRHGANTIFFGTRDVNVLFPRSKTEKAFDLTSDVDAILKRPPVEFPPNDELWTTNPIGPETRFQFDDGPGKFWAKLMKDNIPRSLVKSNPIYEDFSYFRGSFENAKVLIVSDRHSYNDLSTRRVLTGERGEIIQGMMEDLGIGNHYLSLTPAPFMEDTTNPKQWEEVMEGTKTYREVVFGEVMKRNDIQFIVADGKYSIEEVKRILGPNAKVPIIYVNRADESAMSGLKEMGTEIQKIAEFSDKSLSYKHAAIPREHLPPHANWSEGRSGEYVLRSKNPKFPHAYVIVVPYWASKQKYQLPAPIVTQVQSLKTTVFNLAQTESVPEVRECDLLLKGNKKGKTAQE